MDNAENTITLSKNKEIELMPGIMIKTSDQDEVSTGDPLRFYVYASAQNGSYVVKGPVKTVVDGNSYILSSKSFAGFFYDIDKDVGTEEITLTISGNKLDEPNGIVYTSKAQSKNFSFENWGEFKTMGFLGKEYFAGYSSRAMNGRDPFLYTTSDNHNLLADEQLSMVLTDNDNENTITNGMPLKLKEGYELAIKSIDIKGNKAYLELSKDGQVVDSKVIQPSSNGASMADETYYFKKDVGNTKGLVLLAVHFKNAFRSADHDLATIDGVFQISDTPTLVKVDTKYGKMKVASIYASNDTVVLDNKDNAISLTRNNEIALMSDFKIRTADQEEISMTSPLRFYIFRTATGYLNMSG